MIGKKKLSVQINRNRETGMLCFGITTDVTTECRISRVAYRPLREQLALDFGSQRCWRLTTAACSGRAGSRR